MRSTKIVAALVSAGVILASGSLGAALNRGEKALAAKDYDKAIAAFREQTGGRGTKPSWCDDMLQLAYAHYAIREFPEALAVLDELLANADRLGCTDIYRVSAYYYWRGRAGYGCERYEVAAESFARATEVAPPEIPPNYRSPWAVGLQPVKWACASWLAATQSVLGLYREAADSRRRAIELSPKDQWGGEFAALAEAQLAAGQFDEALVSARKSLELRQDWHSASVLGNVLAARRQFAEAFEAYRKALAGDPKRQDLYRSLANAQYAAGDYEAALATCAKEEESAPGDPEASFLRGVILARLGRYDDALTVLGDVIGRMSGVNLGIPWNSYDGFWSVDRQVPGDPGVAGPAKDAGLKAGDRILRVNGQPTRGWDNATLLKAVGGPEGGTVTITFRRPGEAATFDKVMTRKKNISFAAARFLGFRALVNRAKGNQVAAREDAGQCLALDPESAYGLQAQSALDLDAGRFDEAIGRLSGLKNNPFARFIEATAYARKGEPAKALEIYTDIPEADREDPAALRQGARAVFLQTMQGYAQGRLDKAREDEAAGRAAEALGGYAAAIAVSDDATAALIRQRAAILMKANPALTELPEEARKFALRGDVLIKNGAFADALVEYRSALGIAALNPQLHYNTALIHGQLRDYRAAIRSMTVYLQLAPDAPNARAAKDEIYKWEFMLEKQGKK